MGPEWGLDAGACIGEAIVPGTTCLPPRPPGRNPLVHAGLVHRLINQGLAEGEAGEPQVLEMALTDRQGRVRQMLVAGRLLHIAGQMQLLSSYQDVTVQRAAAQASIGEYREMVESANDAILLVEHNLIIECNPAAELLFGRSRADLIGQHPGRPVSAFSGGRHPFNGVGPASDCRCPVRGTPPLSVAPSAPGWQRVHGRGRAQPGPQPDG
ncbi:MAG: PAS domain-containing protein [Aquabacterium sp.]|nr:MAG: PAS domain-containing protein [Aquabacterium sp.]